MSELSARDRLRAMRPEAEIHLGIAGRIYALATEALNEQDAEIARLKAALDTAEGRNVIHAPGARCLEMIISGEADGEAVGTLLRSTDDGQEWERIDGGWQQR